MRWVKFIGAFVILLLLFVGGIVFDIFVIQKFSHKDNFINNLTNKDDLKIEQNIYVSKDIESSLIKTSLNILESNTLHNLQSISPIQRDNITQTLNNIIKLTQENENICKNNSYVFTPNYTNNYEKGDSRGYKIQLNIKCEMDKSQYDTYTKFFNKILEIIDSSEFLDISFGSLDFALSQQEQQKYEAELRQMALKQANDLISQYNENLKTSCYIGKINFGQAILPVQKNYMTMNRDSYMVLLNKTQTPIVSSNNMKLSLFTQLEFICKR